MQFCIIKQAKKELDVRDVAMSKIRSVRGLGAKIARHLNVAKAAIYQWRRVPANRVLQVAPLIGMTPSEIRPDIYPPVVVRPCENDRMIWTGAAYRLLYQELVDKFGPYCDWEKKGSPGRNLDAGFKAFCSNFARIVGAKSGGAVGHQIRFAMPETSNGTTWTAMGQSRTAILNKAAALEMGFIRQKDLPDLYATGNA
jgi:DNA-binding transcriptional regulator YdaS (Cro superfamily)